MSRAARANVGAAPRAPFPPSVAIASASSGNLTTSLSIATAAPEYAALFLRVQSVTASVVAFWTTSSASKSSGR